MNVESTPLNEIIETIAKQHQLRFSYDEDLLKQHTTSIEANHEPIDSFLQRLLEPFRLTIKRSSKQFFYIQSTERRLVFTLKDAALSTPLPYATVQIKDAYKGIVVNEQGQGNILIDRLKDTALVIRTLGYFGKVIDPRNWHNDSISIQLKTSPILLQMTVIMEYLNRSILIQGDVSSLTISIPEMEVLPGLPEPDVLLSTQMLPGFESNDETAAGINIRGSDASQSLVYWDRIPVYQPAHYFGQITSIIPALTHQVQSYKNYVPSYFSGATAGLLNMQSYDSIPKVTELTTNTNFTHSDLSANLQLSPKLGLLIGGRSSYNHLLNTPLFESYSNKLFDGIRELDDEEEEAEINSTLRFWDLNGKVIFEPNDKHYFSFSTLINQDELAFNSLQFIDSSSSRLSQDHIANFYGLNAFYLGTLSEKWSGNLSLSYTNYSLTDVSALQFQDEIESNFDSTDISNELQSWEFKSAITYQSNGGNHYTFGYQLYQYNVMLSYRERNEFEAASSDNRETSELANSFFAQSSIKLKQDLLLRPQLRLDYFSSEEEFFISPILNAQYDLGSGLWLKSSFGQYTQALSKINEEGLTASNVNTGIWVLAGEEDTEVMRSIRGSIGVLYQRKGWLLDLDFYTKEVEGISAINLFEESVTNEFEFSLGHLRSRGLDLMLKKNFGRYRNWLSYTYSKTTNAFDSIQATSFASSLDRPHQFRWVHTYIINQFEFSLGFLYKSGAPFSKAIGSWYDEDDDEYFLRYEGINNRRLPEYHRLDLSLWYRFPKTAQRYNGMIGLSILNLYNRSNVWKRFYYLEDLNEDDEPEVIEEERFFLGLTPNVTLKLNF